MHKGSPISFRQRTHLTSASLFSYDSSQIPLSFPATHLIDVHSISVTYRVIRVIPVVGSGFVECVLALLLMGRGYGADGDVYRSLDGRCGEGEWRRRVSDAAAWLQKRSSRLVRIVLTDGSSVSPPILHNVVFSASRRLVRHRIVSSCVWNESHTTLLSKRRTGAERSDLGDHRKFSRR